VVYQNEIRSEIEKSEKKLKNNNQLIKKQSADTVKSFGYALMMQCSRFIAKTAAAYSGSVAVYETAWWPIRDYAQTV